jgi:hypothetical protein
MTALTNYSESILLNHIMGKTSFTMPTEVYFALFTADPTDAGTLTNEVGASRGYARLAMKASVGTSTAGSAITNSTAFTFGPCVTTNWGTVTHAAIMDVVTLASGNMLWKGALTASKTIAVGDTLVVPIGSFSVALD